MLGTAFGQKSFFLAERANSVSFQTTEIIRNIFGQLTKVQKLTGLLISDRGPQIVRKHLLIYFGTGRDLEPCKSGNNTAAYLS